MDTLNAAGTERITRSIGMLIEAADYADLERIFREMPALAAIQIDPAEYQGTNDEIVRITVAGQTVMSISPRRVGG